MVEFNKGLEICLESFYDNPFKKISSNLHSKLEIQMSNIVDVLRTETDPAHQVWHTIEGISAINLISPLLNLSEKENKKAQMAFRFHDLGYRAVKKGIISYEEHHLASLYFASKLTDDREILSAVVNHSEDVLPYDTPLWARLVNNVDRVLSNGCEGILRTAIFKGFWHAVFEDPIDEAIEKGALVDLNHPLNIAFGLKSEEFFFKEVFPFYDTHDSLVDLSRYCKYLLQGINGYLYTEMHSPFDRFCSLDEIKQRHLDWQVEPILDVVHHLYVKRIDQTHFIRQRARNKYDPPKS